MKLERQQLGEPWFRNCTVLVRDLDVDFKRDIWASQELTSNLTAESCEPGSKLLVLGMVISPLIGTLIMGIINPYYWVDFSHPLLYGNNVS